MAEIKSVHGLMEDYQRHVARLEELRTLLDERLVTAKREMHRLVVQTAGRKESVASGPGSPLRDSIRLVRLRVTEIESAIERMDRGLYGTCRQCGAFIPIDELLRAPHEQRCAGCGHAERARASA